MNLQQRAKVMRSVCLICKDGLPVRSENLFEVLRSVDKRCQAGSQDGSVTRMRYHGTTDDVEEQQQVSVIRSRCGKIVEYLAHQLKKHG